MKKKKEEIAGAISVILRNFICFGFCIQIILGIIWMCCNMLHPAVYGLGESPLYQKVAGLVGVHTWVIVILQLLLAGVAGFRMVSSMKPDAGKYTWAAMAVLVTFPFALQVHCSISPYSVITSVLLLQTGICARLLRLPQKNAGLYIELCLCGILLALILPEYLVLGFIMPVVAGVVKVIGRGRKNAKAILMGVAALVAAMGLCLVIDEAVYDGAQPFTMDHLRFLLANRATVSTILNDYQILPQEAKEVLNEEIVNISTHSGEMERRLELLLQQQFDEATRGEYYAMLTRYAWQVHRRTIITQSGWDGLGYVLTPLILPLQLQGGAYPSGSGRNYELMRWRTPLLTKAMVLYQRVWFSVMLISGLIAVIIGILKRRARTVVPDLKTMFTLILTALGICGFYLFEYAGRMDYKATVYVGVLWNALFLYVYWNSLFGESRSADGKDRGK